GEHRAGYRLAAQRTVTRSLVGLGSHRVGHASRFACLIGGGKATSSARGVTGPRTPGRQPGELDAGRSHGEAEEVAERGQPDIAEQRLEDVPPTRTPRSGPWGCPG